MITLGLIFGRECSPSHCYNHLTIPLCNSDYIGLLKLIDSRSTQNLNKHALHCFLQFMSAFICFPPKFSRNIGPQIVWLLTMVVQMKCSSRI